MTTTAPAATPLEPRSVAVGSSLRRIHLGWVVMVVAGLVAAAANLAVLGAGDPVGEVITIVGDTPPGTPVGQLTTGTVAIGADDPGRLQLVTPMQLADMAGMVTSTTVPDGAALRLADLVPAGTTVASAMSIPIDPARAVGGALSAGDRVDVIADVDGPVAVIVEDVAVLAIRSPGSGLGGAIGTHAITLAVNAEQALRLSAALRDSQIDLVRRGVGG